MASTILGISAFYHDSAAAITQGGEIVGAAQEERFTRKKHDSRFPVNAINFCLEKAFVEPDELDAVVFYDNPVLTFDRVMKNTLAFAPGGRTTWRKAAGSLLGTKSQVLHHVQKTLGVRPKSLLHTDHHLAHAASAYYPSPYDDAAILTVDGVGEWATTSLAKGSGTKISILRELKYPHSLGLLYSAVTYHCGFKVNSGEYKLMGLAPYGQPRFKETILDNVLDLKEDGSFRLNLEHFDFMCGDRMTSDAFADLAGCEARKPESKIEFVHMDLAASVQAVTEDVMLRLARHARALTGSRNLCLAGGVALNCVANGKILEQGIFDGMWIQPAAGDAGGALGAALLATHACFKEPRPDLGGRRDRQRASLVGPAFSSEEIRAWLDRNNYPYKRVEDENERYRRIAEYLAEGRIVGQMAGPMEFGPRALGARSILGDARRPETQSIMNLKIKFRESFRPFAPVVLKERAGEYFCMEADSPYMLQVARVRPERCKDMDWERFRNSAGDMIEAVNQPRSDIPAVTHVDYSARVQTVGREDNAALRGVLEAFERSTGCPVLVNTSFNVRGEPIVCTPAQAYLCFMRTEIDVLVLEDCVLLKDRQPPLEEGRDWRKDHEPD